MTARHSAIAEAVGGPKKEREGADDGVILSVAEDRRVGQ